VDQQRGGTGGAFDDASADIADIDARLVALGDALNVTVETYQSNWEGALIDRMALAMPVFGLRGYQQGSDLGPVQGALPCLAPGDLASLEG
jgi:hypothetical protein